MRFAWLDLDVLRRAIAADLTDADQVPGLAIETQLAITCLDQIGDEKVTYYEDGIRHRERLEPGVAAVADAVGIGDLPLGFGVARHHAQRQR